MTQSPDSVTSIKAVPLPAISYSSTPHDTPSASLNAPCPAGYIATQRFFSGNATCSQDTPLQDGTTLQAMLSMNSDGTGILYEGNFGTETSYTYGEILDRVVDNAPGHILYPAEYANYFLASLQDATAVEQAECGAGLPVTYMGPSAGGGYQVQVADYIPGTSQDPANLSPLPPGDVNLCPPPSSNN